MYSGDFFFLENEFKGTHQISKGAQDPMEAEEKVWG